MDYGLKDKVALVTGAGSQIGFGKGICLTLAKEGCDIIATDIDLKGSEQTAAEVRALGRKAVALKADITQKAEVDNMVKAALTEFGKIDILVNNAGIASQMQSFVSSSEENWDIEMETNYKTCLYCTKAVLPQMVERKSGKIINISSPGAITGVDPASTYTAAKAAVLFFSKSLASELGPSGTSGMRSTGALINSGVNINIIASGPADGGNPGKAQDISNVVAFLASEGARRVSGQVITV